MGNVILNNNNNNNNGSENLGMLGYMEKERMWLKLVGLPRVYKKHYFSPYAATSTPHISYQSDTLPTYSRNLEQFPRNHLDTSMPQTNNSSETSKEVREDRGEPKRGRLQEESQEEEEDGRAERRSKTGIRVGQVRQNV